MPRSSDLLNHLFASIRSRAAQDRVTDRGTQDKVDALQRFLRAHQRVVEADTSPLISILSARQQGKSTFAAILATMRCLAKPGAQWVVVGLTRASVQRIYWDALKTLNEGYKLGAKFQEQKLIVRFPNGSAIHFFGADKVDEIEKLRGGRYHGAIVDECKSYPALILKTLVEDILGAALKGQAGQLYLIGTPGDVLSGEFYLATAEEPILLEDRKRWSHLPAGERTRVAVFGSETLQVAGIWSFHYWGPHTNDVVFRNDRTGETFTMWDAFLEEKARRGYADDHPTWLREYMGRWVPGEGRLVYRYRPHANDYTPDPQAANGMGLPVEETGWRTVLGVDFGTKDGTSFVVWAWHPHQPHMWELYSEKRVPADGLRMPVSSIAHWYKAVEKQYGPFDAAVGDPAGLATMVMDTLAAEHAVYIEPAEKREKLDHIELLNDDLDAGRIHIRRGSELSEELLGNKWLEKTLGTPNRKEDPSTPNDLCDAALYAFRWCLHRQSRPRPALAPPPLSAEAFRAWARAEREKTIADLVARKRGDAQRLDLPWWEN